MGNLEIDGRDSIWEVDASVDYHSKVLWVRVMRINKESQRTDQVWTIYLFPDDRLFWTRSYDAGHQARGEE